MAATAMVVEFLPARAQRENWRFVNAVARYRAAVRGGFFAPVAADCARALGVSPEELAADMVTSARAAALLDQGDERLRAATIAYAAARRQGAAEREDLRNRLVLAVEADLAGRRDVDELRGLVAELARLEAEHEAQFALYVASAAHADEAAALLAAAPRLTGADLAAAFPRAGFGAGAAAAAGGT